MARDPQTIAAQVRDAGVPDELNRWLGMTAANLAAYEERVRLALARERRPRAARFRERGASELSIEREADVLWRNWVPTKDGRSTRRPPLRTFVRLVRIQRRRAERTAAKASASRITPKAPAIVAAAATSEGDDTMSKRKTASKAKTTRKAKTLTAKQRGKSANTSTSRAIAADGRARKTGRLDEISAYITGAGATAKKIGAEFELLEHSVRACITTLRKPVKDGGRGLDVVSTKNADGVTVYSIAR